jgi:hypothetical protein
MLGAVVLALGWRATGAVDPLAAVRARLVPTEVLRGAFAQTKKLAGFRQPLRSTGRFVLVRGRGVLWLTHQPFASTLVVTPDRLESLDAQGQRLSRIDARDDPALRSINQLLLATLAADVEPLRALFTIDAELVGVLGWRLVLRAKDALLARQLERVTLAGESHVREVQLEERNGDSTHIVFSAWSRADAPEADELALLSAQR